MKRFRIVRNLARWAAALDASRRWAGRLRYDPHKFRMVSFACKRCEEAGMSTAGRYCADCDLVYCPLCAAEEQLDAKASTLMHPLRWECPGGCGATLELKNGDPAQVR